MKGCQQLNVILEIINDKLEEGVAEQSDKCSGTREAIIYLRVWKNIEFQQIFTYQHVYMFHRLKKKSD